MNKQFVTSILITFLYGIITLYAVLHHEIWADEAQVWQLCKYLSAPELVSHLHNEGHPYLFYLLVMPFAKLFSNIIYMQLLCWVFMCVAVFLLFYKATFPNIVKFAIITSSGFLYFLPVMARSYAIIPILVFLAAILYSKQKEQPVLYGFIIALIANTHAIMLGFSFILLCLFIYDNYEHIKKKQFIISTIIMIGGIITCFLQIYDTANSNFFISYDFNNLLYKLIKRICYFFINSYMYGRIHLLLIDIPVLIGIIGIIVYIHICLYKLSKKLFFVSVGSFVFQMAIYVCVYLGILYPTRIFSYYVILIFCLWAGNILLNNKKLVIFISIFFLLTMFNGIYYYLKDIKHDYAGSKQTANFIEHNINPKTSTILTDNEQFCIAIAAYLNNSYSIKNISRNDALKYIVWDKKIFFVMRNYEWASVVKREKQLLPENTDLYVIRLTHIEKETLPLDITHKKEFKKIYSSGYTIIESENYVIYKYIGR